jgi:hypothetical protein
MAKFPELIIIRIERAQVREKDHIQGSQTVATQFEYSQLRHSLCDHYLGNLVVICELKVIYRVVDAAGHSQT